MRIQSVFVISILFFYTLFSCSKKSISPTPPPIDTDTVGLNDWRTFYEEVPNALPDLRSYFDQTSGHALSIVVVPADLNKDGLKDLVFHLWHFRTAAESSTIPGSAPVPNRLVALINQGAGRFLDKTAELFGSSAVDLAGGASRKVKIADLNEDGYPDWVYALNREDGRPNIPDWGNKNVAVLSNGNGTYRAIEFGQTAFHHSVDILKNQNGQYTILFDQNETYNFVGNQFIPSDGFPSRNGGTHLSFKSIQSQIPDNFITDKQMPGENPPSFAWYFKNGVQWVEQASFTWTNWWYINVVHSPNFTSRSKVKLYNGKEFIDGGFFESSVIRLSPTAQPTVIVSMATSHVSAGLNGRTTINASEIEPWNKLFSFQIQGSNLSDGNIFDFSEGALNFNFMDTADLNNDNHTDFAVYPYRLGGKPRVYLNNKLGKLILQSEAKFPFLDWNMGSLTSLFVDIDNDKIEDLIYFAGNGCPSGGSCTRFVLYKGKRNLK